MSRLWTLLHILRPRSLTSAINSYLQLLWRRKKGISRKLSLELRSSIKRIHFLILSETIDYIVDSLEPTPKIRSTLESNESDRESYLDFRSKKSARKGSRKRKASLEKDESKGKTVPSIKLDLDLDEVANEDISWIRAIYE